MLSRRWSISVLSVTAAVALAAPAQAVDAASKPASAEKPKPVPVDETPPVSTKPPETNSAEASRSKGNRASSGTVPAGETSVAGEVIPGLTISGRPGEGFSISTRDGRYSLNLRGRFQVRDTYANVGKLRTNDVAIRTVRLILSGHLLSPNIGYYLQLAFGPNDYDSKISAISPIYDAFAEFTHLRDLSLRVGQFYVPFDRARTIREYALHFIDRQQVVTEMSLDRDVGLRLFSEDLGGLHGLFGYSLGIFSGKGKDRLGVTTPSADIPGFLYVARLQIKPFGLFDDDIEGDLTRQMKPRLALGGAFAYNQHTDRAQSTVGSVFGVGSFSYTHWDADLVFKFAGFALLSEYLYRQGTPGALLVTAKPAVYEWARDARGYVIQGGYLLTDWLEAVGRFDHLLAVGKTDPALRQLAAQEGRELGGGLNLYLNKHQMKIQADYFHYWGPVSGAVKNQVRLQVDVSI